MSRAPPMFCTFAPPAGEKNNFHLLRREFVVLRLHKRALLLVPPGVYRPCCVIFSGYRTCIGCFGIQTNLCGSQTDSKRANYLKSTYRFLPEKVGWSSSESLLVLIILAAVTV